MPKYYVQSGNLKLVTTACDSSAAAIWAVHRALSHALPFLRESNPPEAETSTEFPCGGRSPQLGEAIRVSEQGFDRLDAQLFDTLATVTEWNQLLVAIDRLQKRLAAAEVVDEGGPH